jgi:hypothetical protein
MTLRLHYAFHFLAREQSSAHFIDSLAGNARQHGKSGLSLKAFPALVNEGEDSNETPRGTLTVRISAMPADTNANGDIFGGWVLSRMD